MKLNKNLTRSLVLIAGLSGLLATSPIYADYGHHWHPGWHPDHHWHHHHHYDGGDIAAGLFFGAAVGLVAAAAMSHNNQCQRVYYTHYCRDNGWGQQCYNVRHVQYVC